MKTPVKKEIVQTREDYLQEQVICLAEDIIDFNEWRDETAENWNSTIETLNYNFDAITHNNENRKKEIKRLDEKIKDVDETGWYLFIFLVIWNFILTGVLIYYVL